MTSEWRIVPNGVDPVKYVKAQLAKMPGSHLGEILRIHDIKERIERRVVEKIQKALCPELLKPDWRGSDNPLAGHCYVAAEVAFHILGGKAAGYKPMYVHCTGGCHWFLKGPYGIVDPTAKQFKTPPEYREGKGSGFLTKKASKRAAKLLERIHEQCKQAERDEKRRPRYISWDPIETPHEEILA